MDEPRTHYQVSFTSRQAAALFIVLLAALVGSYFFGVLTGLSGREGRPAAASAAATTPSAVEPPFPAPVLGVPARGGRRPAVSAVPKPAGEASSPAGGPEERPAAVPAAAPTPGVQLFEDRPSQEPTLAPAAARPAAAKAPSKAAEAGGFWVQVDSLSSREQAETRRRGMAQAGFHAAIVPGAGPKGTVYRVRVGPYATREEAGRASADVERKAKVKTWVVPPGQ